MKTYAINDAGHALNRIVTNELPVKITRRGELVAVILDADAYIDLTGIAPDDKVLDDKHRNMQAVRAIMSEPRYNQKALDKAGDELDVTDEDANMDETTGGGVAGTEAHTDEASATPPQAPSDEISNTSPALEPESNLILPPAVEKEVQSDLEKLRELKELRLSRLKNEPHRHFVPTGKFEEFINKAMSGRYKDNLFEAANGVGKTFGMANLLANLFWPNDNPYFQAKLFKDWPFSKQGRIISNSNTVVETIIPTLKAVFPKDRFNTNKFLTTKEGKRYEEHWVTDTGFDFRIMTYDQEVTEFESANLGFFWEDEPATREIHTANYSRLRMGGVGFITETPLKGSQWLYDDFVDKLESVLEAEKKSVTIADVESACIEHGLRGFIPHKRILDQVSGYDDEEKMARVFGKHHHLSGLIFKKYTNEVHVIKPFTITKENFVVVQALDPHPRNPDAVLWAAIDRYGNTFVINELFGEYETSLLAERVKDTEKNWRVVKRLIDPSAFNIDKHTGYQLANDLSRNYYLDYEPGSKARTEAIEKIREALNYEKVGDQVILPPKLFVFDICEKFRWEISRYQWQDWRGITAQFKNPKEKPVDKDDHLLEDLGRILLADVKFTDMVSNPVPREIEDSARRKAINLDPY